MSAWFDVRVSAVRAITPVIREFTFEALDGTLPGFSSGSHVQLCLPNGVRNAYSLLGDPAETGYYRNRATDFAEACITARNEGRL